eukprot:Tbor_TRINITY_DN6077_c2_g3::TRINITY_DN6077_c2_g3_i1::g.11107::m.11107/K00927/PGK, pgk; phosphoglycerate kinase
MTLKIKKTVSDISPMENKRVLVRVDFNVPMKDGEITNDYRIREAVETIKSVTDRKGICIIISHLGRPTGVLYKDAQKESGIPGYEKEYSLWPVVKHLSEILNQEVAFAHDSMDADKEISKVKPGGVIILENCRFYKNESSKKPEERAVMTKKLASYGDYYVSDAFGTAHRDSASISGLPRELGHGAAGFLMAREINYFSKLLVNPPHPMVAIIGGSKVSDKILLLENMLSRVDKLLIGGAMAYTFLKAEGYNVGKSMVETKSIDLAHSLLTKAKELKVEVLLPIDHICNTEFKATETPLVTKDANIPDDAMALDIGPKTLELFTTEIKKCKTAVWNGPMGVFEMECYSKGTFGVAKAMGDQTELNELMSVIGGGDSASAAELCGQSSRVSHVSTGGGASLELLEGKNLPGVAALDDM